MPFYTVEQKGVPGKRLIEAEKPAGAVNHVVEDQFIVKRVDGRELLDAWQECGGQAERAGGPAPSGKEDNQADDGDDGNAGSNGQQEPSDYQ
jgi:hypothetical protein